MFCQVGAVLGRTRVGHEVRLSFIEPFDPNKIDSRKTSHATLVNRLAAVIENRQLHPLKVRAEPSRPDDRRDTRSLQIDFPYRTQNFIGFGHSLARRSLLRTSQAGLADILID